MKKASSMSDLIQKEINSNVYFRLNYIKTTWNEIVGKNLAKKTYPIFIKNKILHIGVENSAWLQQMRMLEKNITKNINEYLNGLYVEKLKFKISKDKKSKYENTEIESINEISINDIVLEKEDIYQLKKSLSKIEDYELKKRLYTVMTNNKKREKYLLANGYKKCIKCHTIFQGKDELCYSCINDKQKKFEEEIYYYIYKNPFLNFEQIKIKYNKVNYELYARLKNKLKSKVYEKILYLKEKKDIEKLKEQLNIYIKLETGIKNDEIVAEKIENLLLKK